VLVLFQLNPAILQSLPWLAPEQGPVGEQLPPEQGADTEQLPEDNPPEDNPPEQNPPEQNPPEDDPPTPPALQKTVVALTGRYYTYKEMKEDMALLAERYPDTMSYRSYGTSADGRDLLAATLGNPNAEQQVIITAGMHAREYVNSYAVMQQLEYYLKHYDTAIYKGRSLRELFDQVCFIIVPMTNPDGITMAQEGLGAIRDGNLRATVKDICRSLGITG
jgi:murein tripeptide amidase MpaA